MDLPFSRARALPMRGPEMRHARTKLEKSQGLGGECEHRRRRRAKAAKNQTEFELPLDRYTD